MAYGYIYSIENQVNGKVYIGQSVNPQKRVKKHLSELNGNYHHNLHLQRAFNKYGEDSFLISIICAADSKEELDELEKFEILKNGFPDINLCYNQTPGGDGFGSGKDIVTYRYDLDDDEIVKMYVELSLSTTQIAEKLNTTKHTIRFRLKKHGINVSREKCHYRKQKNIHDSFLLFDYHFGNMSTTEVAEKYNIATSTVNRRLKPYNVLRTPNIKSGFKFVTKQKSPRFKQRFIWKYTKKTNGKKKQFSSNDLNKLEEKVLAAGYPWEKLEEN